MTFALCGFLASAVPIIVMGIFWDVPIARTAHRQEIRWARRASRQRRLFRRQGRTAQPMTEIYTHSRYRLRMTGNRLRHLTRAGRSRLRRLSTGPPRSVRVAREQL